MNELPLEVRRLLEQARQGLTPSDADAARLGARLQGALHSSLLDAPRALESPLLDAPRALESWLSPAKLKPALMGALLGLGAGAVLGYQLGPRLSNEEVPTVTPAAPIEEAPPLPREAAPTEEHAPVDEALPAPSERRPRARVATGAPLTPTEKKPSATARKHDAGLVVDELEHVRRVQRALAQQQPGLALRLLEELDRGVPRGRLLEERAAARAIARCLSEPSRGAVEQRVFLQHFPRSVHEERVSSVCRRAAGGSSGIP